MSAALRQRAVPVFTEAMQHVLDDLDGMAASHGHAPAPGDCAFWNDLVADLGGAMDELGGD